MQSDKQQKKTFWDNIKGGRAWLGAITLFYILSFFLQAYFAGNHEFFFYAIVIAVLVFLLIRLVDEFYVKTFVLVGLSFIGFLNFLGGSLYINGVRLYENSFLWGMIKYDNITHFVGALFVAFMMFEFLEHMMDKSFPKNRDKQVLFFLFCFFAAFGVMAGIEVVEFIAVGMLGVEDKVGDYYNNAIDLVVNFWGVFIAIFLSLLGASRRKKIHWF